MPTTPISKKTLQRLQAINTGKKSSTPDETINEVLDTLQELIAAQDSHLKFLKELKPRLKLIHQRRLPDEPLGKAIEGLSMNDINKTITPQELSEKVEVLINESTGTSNFIQDYDGYVLEDDSGSIIVSELPESIEVINNRVIIGEVAYLPYNYREVHL